MTTRQDKPGGKPRQRNRKADQRSQKSDQQRRPTLDQREEEQVRPMVASSDIPAIEAVAAVDPVEPVEPVGPVEMPLVGEVLPPVEAPTGVIEASDTVSIQTIANAYADYARTQLQESTSFVDKLMGVRSFDKAIELQSEFARQAYANFVAESQKICQLYSVWARQIFRPWESATARLTQAGRRSW